jgi:hypothetical protein
VCRHVEAAKQRMLRVLCVLVSLPEIVAGIARTSASAQAWGLRRLEEQKSEA